MLRPAGSPESWGRTVVPVTSVALSKRNWMIRCAESSRAPTSPSRAATCCCCIVMVSMRVASPVRSRATSASNRRLVEADRRLVLLDASHRLLDRARRLERVELDLPRPNPSGLICCVSSAASCSASCPRSTLFPSGLVTWRPNDPLGPTHRLRALAANPPSSAVKNVPRSRST